MADIMNVDLNCDMGELPEAVEDGSQEAIMPFITSVNIASGGHAGDESTMRATVEQARRWKLAIGAHPSYPDRVNFGRLPVQMPAEAIAQTVFEQVRTLAKFADLHHVKPHGALYNTAAADPMVARAIAGGVARFSKDLVLVGLAGSVMLDVFRDAGFDVAAEAFADRRYEADGTLRSRQFADALITDPALAAQQAIAIVENSSITGVRTICVHGDTVGASKIASMVFQTLQARGFHFAPIGSH